MSYEEVVKALHGQRILWLRKPFTAAGFFAGGSFFWNRRQFILMVPPNQASF